MDNIIQNVLDKIKSLQANNEYLIIAIDGRCAAGKSTLAKNIKSNLDCNVIHVDHFFLRPEQKTNNRLNEPGGNVDYERFYSDIIIPLRDKRSFSYTPYDCRLQKMSSPVKIDPKAVNVIEGAYSCHPVFNDHYDYRIFIDIDDKEQKRRIMKRNGKAVYKIFKEKWIPMEELYFSAFNIKDKCDIILIQKNINNEFATVPDPD